MNLNKNNWKFTEKNMLSFLMKNYQECKEKMSLYYEDTIYLLD